MIIQWNFLFHSHLGSCPECDINDKIKKKNPINAARMIQNIRTIESEKRQTVRRHISWPVIEKRKSKWLTSVVLQCTGIHKDRVHVIVVVLVYQLVFWWIRGVLHCLSIRWWCESETAPNSCRILNPWIPPMGITVKPHPLYNISDLNLNILYRPVDKEWMNK